MECTVEVSCEGGQRQYGRPLGDTRKHRERTGTLTRI